MIRRVLVIAIAGVAATALTSALPPLGYDMNGSFRVE
jgi:hypothetical protein